MRRVPHRRPLRVPNHQASELSPTSPESPHRDHACGSGPVGAGPARERVAVSHPAGFQKLFSPERPRRDRVGPSRTRHEYIPVGAVGRRTALAIPGQTRSWTGPPDPGAPWEIRRHKPHFVERSRRCSDPWRCRCQVSGAMVVPGGSCLAREGQTNSGQGWLERSRKAPPLHRVSDTELRSPEQYKSLESCRELCSLSGRGPLPQARSRKVSVILRR